MAENKIKLPENFDPYDLNLKKLVNPKADEKNYLILRGETPLLLCGAIRSKMCRMIAGSGTEHVGYGRCKYHGGRSTGPKTEEGKQKAAEAPRKHGLYSDVLAGEEKELYEQMVAKQTVTLEHEIFMQKAKILGYLKRCTMQFEELKELYGEEEAYRRTKVYYNEGDSGARNFYHAGTIEDRPLDRALVTLSRLVEKHAKLTNTDSENIIEQINKELKAASQGQVFLSWGGKAQERKEGSGVNEENR